MIRKNLIKSLSVIMAAMLAVMTVACGKATENIETAAVEVQQEQTLENSMTKSLPITSTESDAGKVETVYVTADANGAVNDVVVSEWLKNATASAKLDDTTNLKNIVNVKGPETYTENGDGTVTWAADGADIYYQGTTDKELPVDMKITYTLDGKEISPEELAGKSGRVTMKFEYDNKAKQTVEVNGKDIEVYTPFAMVSGMMLDSDKFTNVEISNGKVISDGGNYIVMGVAVPGLKESLDISDDKWDEIDDSEEIKEKLSNSFEITADTSDFELGMTVTMASSDLLSDFGMSDLSDSDKIEDLRDDMEELNDGANKLVDGSKTLKDGTTELRDGVSDLYDGTGKLKDGTGELYNGTGKLYDGTGSLYDGTKSLYDGVVEYTDGVSKVNDGAAKLAKGAASAKEGADKLIGGMKKAGMEENAKALADGAKAINEGAQTITTLTSKLTQVAGAVNKLNQTKDGYDAAFAWLTDQSNTTTPPNDVILTVLQTIDPSLTASEALKIKAAGMSALGGQIDTSIYVLENYVDLITEVEMGTLYREAGFDDVDDTDEDSSADTSSDDGSSDESGLGDENEAGEGSGENAGSGDDSGSGDGSGSGSEGESDNGSNENAGSGTENGEGSDEDGEVIPEAGNEEEVIVEEDEETDVTGNGKKVILAGAGDGYNAGQVTNIASYAMKYGKLLGGTKAASQTIATVLDEMKDLSAIAKDPQLAKKIEALTKGTAELEAGTKKFSEGLGSVVEGTAALDKGLGDLSKGMDQLADGTGKLVKNNDKLVSGTKELSEGAGKLNDGAKELNDGAKELNDGAIELNDGAGTLNDGVIELDDGVQELLDGVVKFDEEGIKKIYDAFDGDLTDFADRLKAIQKAGSSYTSFGGSADDVDSSVKFIIKTGSIKSQDL